MSNDQINPAPQSVQVDNVENVNVTELTEKTPMSLTLFIGIVTAAVLLGFGIVTYAVLSGEAGRGIDAATKGSIIQTWNNMAVAVVAVWTTSRVVDRLRGH